MDVRNSEERDVFWEAYRGCAEENRVQPDRSPFYVKWAKDFANFLPEKPLQDRSRKDIKRHTGVAPTGKHPVQEAITKTGVRDRVIPGEVERQFSELVEAVKTEIRTRHYSYRTETAYLDWVRRFVAFHNYANPSGLDAPTAVKTYLEYLAVEREVAASTHQPGRRF